MRSAAQPASCPVWGGEGLSLGTKLANETTCFVLQEVIMRVLLTYTLNMKDYKKFLQNYNFTSFSMGVKSGLKLREEHRLNVFENWVLGRIFGPKRDVLIGGWRKLHNKELHNLYSSQNIIRMISSRRMRWASHVATMGEMRNVYKILDGKPEGKGPLRRLVLRGA
jgi:hypothetical protein